MSIYKRLSYGVLSLAVLVFIILPAVLLSLLSTHTGSQWLLNLGKPLVAESIQFEGFEGRLLDQFSVRNVTIDTGPFAAQLSSASLTWSPRKLFAGNLVINDLVLGSGEFRLRAADSNDQSAASSSDLSSVAIQLPLAVELQHFSAQPSWVFINDAPEQKLALTAAASLSAAGDLKVEQLVVEHQYTTLDLTADAKLAYPFSYQLELLARLHSPDYPKAALRLASSGDLEELSGSLQGQDNLAVNTEFSVVAPLSSLSWKADVSLSQLQPSAWINALTPISVDESLTIDGVATFSGDKNTSLTATPDLTVKDSRQAANVTGKFTLNKDKLEIKQLTGQLEGLFDGVLTLNGRVGLGKPVTMDLQLQSDEIAYQETRNSGQIDVKGAINQLNLDTRISTQFPNQHRAELLAAAQLTASELNITNFQLSDSQFDGKVKGDAKISWNDGIKLHSSIEGELFEKPVSLVTDLSYQQPYIEVDQFNFAWQGITATAQGMMAPGRQLRINAEIPDLQNLPLLPIDAAGALSVSATAEGDLQSPWAEVQINSQRLSLQDQLISDLNLLLSGNLAQQSLSLQGIIANTDVDLGLTSQLSQNAVKLIIEQLTLAPEELEQFALTKKATINYQWQDANLQIDDFCVLQQSVGEPVCLKTNKLETKNSEVSLQLTAYKQPLSIINYFTPTARVRTEGDLDVDVSSVVNLRSFTPKSVTARLQSDNLMLTGMEDSILVDNLLVEIMPDGDVTSLSLMAVAEEADLQVDGKLSLSELTSSGELGGSVQASLADIGIIEILVAPIGAAKGQLNADITIGGQLLSPTVMPHLTADIEELLINPTGTLVTDTQLSLQPSAEGRAQYQLQGSGSVGDGQFSLRGKTDTSEQSFSLQLNGQQLRLLDTPQLSVYISPDMQVNFAERHLSISGDIAIPQALITPLRLSGETSPSADVVIKQQKTEPSETGITSSTNVTVTLGDKVRVSAYGFEGELTGGMSVSQSSESIARATGKVGVKAGTYEIYGQELTIDTGQLIYNGGPVDNPGLNLQVVRDLPDSGNTPEQVGAQVRGTLRNPELNLFSDPAMPDASVLSYLLFGRPPNSDSESSNLELQAALLLTGNITDSFTENLKNTFGFDEVALESETENVNDTSLYLGKYLTPKLYIKYGIGLIESTSSFFLRYQLTDHLWIESTSSAESQSGDLMYSIEK
ncbi:translocation/assembly module TamB domain-containing protein [Idiomarina seosinensis]|uniref:translocation/assembly module TamB domain-containing protein n=1 Tax=Idiomarina seosinensis TaxID=281739 RepID=UPI00384A645C